MLAVNLPLNCRPQLLDVSSALWSVESTAYQETAYYAAIKTFSLNKIYAWKTERRPLDLLQFALELFALFRFVCCRHIVFQ